MLAYVCLRVILICLSAGHFRIVVVTVLDFPTSIINLKIQVAGSKHD